MEYRFTALQTGITGSTLKIIAIITMLIDHVGAFLVEKIVLAYGAHMTVGSILAPYMTNHSFILRLYHLNTILRGIGRISFPIFAFLIVEGFLHTRSLQKYALRLLLFAFLSETPFNLAGAGTLTCGMHQNIYFTLFIGLMVIACFHWIDQQNWHFFVTVCTKSVPLALGCLLAYMLKSDYDAYGVLTIAILYLFRTQRSFSIFASGILLTFLNALELCSLFAILPVSLYNGKKGVQTKYLFYIFYPLHLLVLYLIGRWLGVSTINTL